MKHLYVSGSDQIEKSGMAWSLCLHIRSLWLATTTAINELLHYLPNGSTSLDKDEDVVSSSGLVRCSSPK